MEAVFAVEGWLSALGVDCWAGEGEIALKMYVYVSYVMNENTDLPEEIKGPI